GARPPLFRGPRGRARRRVAQGAAGGRRRLAPLPGRRARRLGPHSERLKERRLPVTSRRRERGLLTSDTTVPPINTSGANAALGSVRFAVRPPRIANRFRATICLQKVNVPGSKTKRNRSVADRTAGRGRSGGYNPPPMVPLRQASATL